MTPNTIARASKQMATLTLALIIMMLLINTALWFFPSLSAYQDEQNRHFIEGMSFALTRQAFNGAINMASLLWWQQLGGIVLSSIPLLALTVGLYHLRALFQGYARQDYFSVNAAIHLGKVGRAVILWVVLNFICEPLLSVLISIRAPAGERMMTLSLESSALIALFLAACIMLIAQILKKASDVATENQQFL